MPGLLSIAVVASAVVVAPVATDVARAENWAITFGAQTIGADNTPLTGTAPFDANTASGAGLTVNAGNDATTQNDVVRAGDYTTYLWSVSASNLDPTPTQLNNATLEQVFTPNPGLAVTDLFVQTPTVGDCPIARSVQVNVPVGSITVRCSFNLVGGNQRSIPIMVQAEATSINGSSFSSTQRVFATEADGDLLNVPYDLSDDGKVETVFITSRPEWQLRARGFFEAPLMTVDPDGAGPLGLTLGYRTLQMFDLSSPRKGSAALVQPLTFTSNFTIGQGGVAGPVANPDQTYYVIGCIENATGYGDTVFGTEWYHFPVPESTIAGGSETDDCVYNRVGDPNTGNYTFTVKNIDFSPPSFPTKSFTGVDYTNGPFVVGSWIVSVFVPVTTLEASDGLPNNRTGSIDIYSAISMHDAAGNVPVSLTGVPNYAGNPEPGDCTAFEDPFSGCDLMSASPIIPSDNKLGPFNLTIVPPGSSIQKETYRTWEASMVNPLATLPNQPYYTDGSGLAEPGMTYVSRFYSKNDTPFDLFNTACDVFDNSTQVLTDLSPNMSPPLAAPAYYNFGTYNAALQSQNVVEWGHVDLSADNPLSVNGDFVPDFNGAASRYDGAWPNQFAASKHCGDDNTPVADNGGVRWFTDPNQVPASAGSGSRSIDNVNIVRVRAVGATPNHGASEFLLIGIGLKPRNTFYGGPYNGQLIPIGTIMPNMSNQKFTNADGSVLIDYNTYPYNPNAHFDTAADRVTLTRGYLSVFKRTVAVPTNIDYDNDGVNDTSQGAAPYDNNGAAAAGAPVVWEMTPGVGSSVGGTNPVPATMIDVLPPGVTYQAACTAALAGVVLPTSIDANTNDPANPGAAPGYTLITWDLGARVPNVFIGPYRICTTTDGLSASGTGFENKVTVSSPGYVSANDSHIVTVSQGQETKVAKEVDAPLDLQNDNEVWTLKVRNFSTFAAPVNPVLIDVLPYNGDANSLGGGVRNPATAFAGTNVLTGAPVATSYTGGAETGTFTYTSDAPATINQNPDSNTSIWCLASAFGSPGCPANFAAVTGIKYTSDRPLAVRGAANGLDGLKVTYTLDATGNNAGDIYTNRFAMDSPSFPAAQYLLSNPVTVKTVGFRVGDYMWNDINGNGKVDANEPPVPNGVTVQLFKAGDTPGVTPPRATTTTVGGTWSFDGLLAGDYFVFVPASQFQAGGKLVGFVITPAAPEASANADANDTAGHNTLLAGASEIAAGVKSQTITLSATTAPSLVGDEPTLDNTHSLTADPTMDRFSNFTLDLALQSPPVSIGDRVWLDVNRDGLQTPGEPNVEGVTVELYEADGTTLVGTTITDPNGFYSFVDLSHTTQYVVKFIAPADMAFTSQFSGAAANDSNANPATGVANVTTPVNGANSATTPDEPTIDAGLVKVDLTLDKVRNTAAPMYPGGTVTFTLTPHNIGTTNALAGWKVTDVLPAGLTLVSMAGTAPSSTYTCVANVCTSSVPLAAGGNGETILVTATIDAPTTATTLHNVAYISPPLSEVPEVVPEDPTPPSTPTDTTDTPTNNDSQADVPVTPLISIGDTVWLDVDRDGIQDGGTEVGVEGVTVNLYAANGTTLIATTSTGPNGFYSFDDLLPSTNYVVEFIKPVGDAFTTPTAAGSTIGNDSNPVVATGRATVTTPADGLNSLVTPDDPTIDAGLVRVDLTLDKALTSGGPFPVNSLVTFTLTPHNIGTTDSLAGWSVTEILPVGLQFVSMAGTAGASTYTCSGVTCTSSVVLPAGGTGETILVTARVTAAFGGTVHNVAYISPAPGEVTEVVPLITPDTNTNTSTTPTNNDAQATLSAVSIGDYVWRDIDRDGIQDTIEPAVVGVVVNLYAADGTTFIATTTTNPNGFYSFTGLLPSTNYVVKFTAPVNESFTLQNAAGSTTVDDSNVDALGVANVTTPAVGTNSAVFPDEPTIDAGIVKVDLTLAKVLNTSGVVYPGDTVTYTLTPRNLANTDALVGWSVTEVLPTGLTLVSMAGTEAVSTYTCVANVCTSSVVLPAGGTAETILVTATVDPTVAVTLHNVAYVSPGPNEVPEVNPLVVPDTTTNTSTSPTNNDAQANLTVTPLISIGDTVWLDVDRDGIQDGGAEVGVEGVTVNLYAANGTTLIATTTTDPNGFYSFTGLNLSTNYVVEFVAPAGDTFTTPTAAGSTTANDSNPAILTGRTTVTTPANGLNSAVTPDDPTIDAGLVRVDLALAKVRNEAGPFYERSTVSFTLTPTNVGTTDALAGWKVTDILPTGLTAVSIAGSGAPSTYTCVLATLTCTSSVILPAGGTAETIIVTVTVDNNFVGTVHNVAYVSPAPGEVPEVNPLVTPSTTTDTSGTPTNNDAQAYVPVDSLVSIGDTVWLDVDRDGIQDGGAEVGVSGVTVNLYAADGTTLIASTTTNDNGFYSFDDLTPGDSYVVEFVAPADNTFTTQNAAGSTVGNDSNADVVTGRATVLAPAVGVNSLVTPDEPTIDAGVVNIELVLDKQLDTAPNYYPGKTVTYTLTPSNDGTTDSLPGWTVTEILPAGMTLVSMAGTGAPSTYSCVGSVCTSSVPLAAGADGETVLVTATIDPNISGVLHNVAYITPAPADVVETVPLGTPPTTTTDTGTSPTNNDDQADLESNIYDLALAKTGTVTGTGEDTVIDYEVTVANQGTVASGDYTVVDIVPPGLVPQDISDGGVYDAGAGTITWSLTGLAVSAQKVLTWSATVGDFTLRQYRNFAEITADSGAPWGDDNDSTPDGDNTNDGDYDVPGVDNDDISEAGNGADPEDDADIADVTVELTYDLALAKTVSATSVDPAGTATFTITVENQGDVASGAYTVVDTLPAGTAGVTASDGGVISGSTVTWALTDLAPGATRSVTVTVEITDITLRPFKNIAEITTDGADDYDAVDTSLPGADVEDEDSLPDTDTGNDGDYGTFENPTNDIDDIADVDSVPNGEDDADVAFFDAPVLYDLALIKTGPAAIAGNGTATFTLTIKNQGNVPSGDFTVVDEIPTGLIATAASDGGVIADPLVTWNLTGLAAGATTTVTVTVKIIDFNSRPWVNVAEITSDGADGYDTDGYEDPADGDVEDDDSTPDTDPDNDVLVDQTVLPSDQHNDPTVDEDDHDVAPIDADIDYDLALVKVLRAGQSFKKGDPIVFDISVKNQGNVDSGPITVQDVVPAGLGVVTASDGGLGVGQVVTWEIANLTPGQIKTLTVTVTVIDDKLISYINLAEIVADGADQYDTPGDDVEDDDSTPDSDIANDPLVDTDDVNIDQIPGDEDDHDRALLDPAKVKSDNPKGGTIPKTGGDTAPLLYAAAGLSLAGVLTMMAARRRRRQAATIG